MSKEHAKLFLDKLNQDPEFKRKMQNASPEEAKRIMDENGLHFTKEDLTDAYKTAVGRELSEKELTQIAGGTIPGTSVALGFNLVP